ncbi:hypothetical protein GCM10010988_35290 [Cnuibacter physcomitrellae]|uniref:Uncharacterized protein n=1 Tax=Cnuibacter physcomitrellae TaxID=1619308 RepID=A0A1X9LSK2_9MICO|nr:hypothetical protein [Cnuibacter physcomitrellae]ARJ04870.1 hypothetical protein B5808_06285 [Cnuibacter physcomitrellae]GGI41692.1 hypothetical protein GCM10010988_35290 [Cnuibacter physcomitrellae]
MQVLIAQAVIATISVAGGALIALAVERWRGRRSERLTEVSALRLLIVEIAARRALAHDFTAPPLTLDRADPSSDLNSAVRSIRLLRKDVRAARAELRAASSAWGELDEMVAACNVFIEATEAHPQDLAVEVDRLRSRLEAAVRGLVALYPDALELRLPGSMAYASR